jgi:anti-anti-sigma factor
MGRQDQRFELVGNRLVVKTDLDMGASEELRKRCDHLLNETGAEEVVIDLTAVKHMHSLSMGVLTSLWIQASGQERHVRFVVSAEVADLLERTGLAGVLKYELPGD